MLTPRCLKVVLILVTNIESDVATTFTQHGQNIVSMSVPNVESNIAITSTQCCLNVVSTLAEISQGCDNVVATLAFWLKENVGTVFTQHGLDIHTTWLGHFKVSTNEHCHSVMTDIETMLAPTF